MMERSPGTGPRVAYLLSTLAGGTAEHLRLLLRRRSTGAWDAVVVGETQDASRGDWPDPVVVLPRVPLLSRFPLSQWLRLQQIRRCVRRMRPDILHTYFFWSIIYGRVLKASGMVRHLVENREDLGFAWGRFEYLLLRATSRYPDRVICVCDAVRDVVASREKIPADRIVVIRNGIEIPDSRARQSARLRTELGIRGDEQVVGMLANFDRPVKGVDHFIDCIPHVVKARPSTRFLLVGRGPDPDRLLERARRLGVEGYLTLTGFRTDIDDVYDLMNISVLTSLSEGLSITILESMARGLPVVATRVGGNPELVVDGTTGRLVPPADPGAMAVEILRLLDDEDLCARWGAAGRKTVEAEFRLDLVAERYASVYRAILRGTAG